MVLPKQPTQALTAPDLGDFWVEGDAAGVELFPAAASKRSASHSPAARVVADPEKAVVKEWAVEELEVAVERVEVSQPKVLSNLPPVPDSLRELRGELAGLERATAQLKDGTHPSVKNAKAAIREAEVQLQVFQEDLDSHVPELLSGGWALLEKMVAENTSTRPSEFCKLAPNVNPRQLLPFVARLRNVRKARLALDAVRGDLRKVTDETIKELGELVKSKREEHAAELVRDLRAVVIAFSPSPDKADLMESWPNLEPQLVARQYPWDSLELLKKVEAFLYDDWKKDGDAFLKWMPPSGKATFPMTPEETQNVQHAAAEGLGFPKTCDLECSKGIAIALILVPPGYFLMGSPTDERGRAIGACPLHTVTISRPFYMGVTPVTQSQYKAIIGQNPSQYLGHSNPVEHVCWQDADLFCKKLTDQVDGIVRLPTEAEWEYACRAGSAICFSFGDDETCLDQYAWYDRNSVDETHPVAHKKPNPWGLYDMRVLGLVCRPALGAP